MEAKQFLDIVLPDKGNKVLALATPTTEGNGVWFKYKTYKTAQEVTVAAELFDEKAETVYFAVNSFGDWYKDEAKGKNRLRTQENVVACRSLYDDFDVGSDDPKKYTSREEALNDIIKLAQAVKLTPTITSSGGGYHCYFSLDEDVTQDIWRELSSLKRDITTHLRIKPDRAVDMDSARILRPVGTYNRKSGTPVPVEMVKLGKQYPVETVRAKMQGFIKEQGVQPAPTERVRGKIANPFAAALGDHPPSDANQVAEHCAAIRKFRDTKGDIPEPHWHRAIGVVKHCTDGERIIHDWSRGYSGYSEGETQAKIDEWNVGPTSCAEMDRHIGCMKECPMVDKCKYPIQLGNTETVTSTAEETEVPENNAKSVPVIEGESIPYWPASGYRWNGSALSRSVVDADGVVHWRPFSRSFIYPINRIQDKEGTWVVHWRTKEKNGNWREFFMPTSELASTDLMAKTLASHEVFLTRTRNARNDMAEFAEGCIETLQAWRIETKTYKQFGWTDDRKGFVMGTKLITLAGEEDVLCDPDMPSDIVADFGTSGTLDEWVSNIKTLYDRPKAEPFQFAICHAMGSVLVPLMNSSNWHGLSFALTGFGGTGKSTIAKTACGFYGNPEFMERQTGEQGSTLNAAIKRIAIMGSVPMLLDEFSGRQPDELTRTGYALANGRDKERLGPSGKFATVGGQWFKNSFITSNDSLHESISKLPAGYRVEATQLRFFEVQLPESFITDVFPDVTQTFMEHHMDNVYGEACRPFIRFVIKNHDWVCRQLTAARVKLNPSSQEDNKERFYRDTIVTALVAGKIAERLGLISFDLNLMKKWALSQVLKMRESRKESNTDISEHIALFISTLPGRLIITKRFGDSRVKHKEAPMEMLRGPAVGRVCTEDKKVYITAKSVNDWCKENGVAPAAMKEELDRDNYLIYTAEGKPSHKCYIGSGSTIPSGQSRCYEFKYGKLFGDTAPLHLVETDSGVMTETVLDDE
jgi:hypothetical protein